MLNVNTTITTIKPLQTIEITLYLGNPYYFIPTYKGYLLVVGTFFASKIVTKTSPCWYKDWLNYPWHTCIFIRLSDARGTSIFTSTSTAAATL